MLTDAPYSQECKRSSCPKLPICNHSFFLILLHLWLVYFSKTIHVQNVKIAICSTVHFYFETITNSNKMLTTERHRACEQESTFHLPFINIRIHFSFRPDYRNSKYEQFIKLLAYTFRNTVSFSSSSCSIAFASNGTFQTQSMHNCPTKQYTCFHQENTWTEQQLFILPFLTWFVIVISSICRVSFLQSYKLEITRQF